MKYEKCAQLVLCLIEHAREAIHNWLVVRVQDLRVEHVFTLLLPIDVDSCYNVHMAIHFWFSSHLWLAMLDPEVDLEHHWVEDHWPWREYLLLYCACVQIQCGLPPSPLSVLWAWQLEHMWNQEWSYWPPITSGMWPVYSQWPWICRRCEFNVSCCFLLLFFLVSHNESS